MTGGSVRPSGLTALAVLNFVFGGMGALGSLFGLAALGCVAAALPEGSAFDAVAYSAAVILQAAAASLMIVSGVGYLKMKRGAGRVIGNVAALLSIASVASSLAFPSLRGSSQVSIATVMSLCWPLMALFFANYVFRDVWSGKAPSPEKGLLAKVKGPRGLLIALYSFKQGLRGGAGVVFCLVFLVAGLLTAEVLLIPLELTEAVRARSGLSEGETLDSIMTYVAPFLDRMLGEESSEPLMPPPGDARALGIAYRPAAGSPSESGAPPGPGAPGAPRAARAVPAVRAVPASPAIGGRSWGSFLLSERPGFLSLFFLAFTFVFPLVAVLGGFDQISGDNKNRGLRFLLLRTRRLDYYAGKFASTAALAAMMAFLLFAAILVYVQAKLGVYPLSEALPWTLWGLLCFILISLPYLSLSMSFSAITMSGIGSFGASAGFLVAMLLPDLLAMAWKPAGYLRYLFPAEAAKQLFHPDWWRALLGGAGLVLYAAAYALPGALAFKRRDL